MLAIWSEVCLCPLLKVPNAEGVFMLFLENLVMNIAKHEYFTFYEQKHM